MDSQTKYLIALSHFYKFGPKRLRLLYNHYNNYERAWQAPVSELHKIGLNEGLVREFAQWRENFDLKAVLNKLEREKISVLKPVDRNYPSLLKQIPDYPAILYIKGNPAILSNRRSLAVVGTRKLSPYGQRHTHKICRELAAGGFSVISGLALGIDSVAHRATLEAGGLTAAVLATGADTAALSPRQNLTLYHDIIKNKGAIVSEFPLGTQGLKHHFPQRNRLIAGLCQATLVVEANIPSGALITAYLALDYNREVLALPGPIDAVASRGPNELIKKGAKPVLNVADIWEVYNLNFQVPAADAPRPENKEEKAIIRALENGQKHINEIINLTKLDTSVINSTISGMEIKKMVKNVGGMYFVSLI